MAVETLQRERTPMATAREVIASSKRSLAVWALALTGVTAMYVGLYPSMSEMDIEGIVGSLPDGMVEALGYDQIGTAAGYINSTIYGLLGPILLSVFAIGLGARLIGGSEENGSLELEFAAPVSRTSIYLQRWLALTVNTTVLVVVVALVTLALIVGLDLDVAFGNLIAATTGLWLLVLGFGTIAYAVGAATGRRAIGLGAASAFGVAAFMLDALGPNLDAGWMQTISPWSWYIADQPLANGWDATGIVLLVLVPVLVGLVGLRMFTRRDLMV